MSDTYGVGIDVGSTTLKVCVVDGNDCVVFDRYVRHNADPSGVLLKVLEEMKPLFDDSELSVTVTGSVGMGIAERLHLPFEQEVIAAAEVVSRKYGGVRTFIDIGGEDSKIIFFEEGRVPDMRMNGNCAGGTGSFIDQTASLLDVPTEQLDELAAQSQTIYPIASRCGVFSKTDIQNLLARNVSKADIAASMFRAVALQVVSALTRGMEVKSKVFLCGGPFTFLPQLRKHMLAVLQLSESDCILPDHANLVPAMGCALLSSGRKTSVDGLIAILETCGANTVKTYTSLQPLFNDLDEYERWIKDKEKYHIARADAAHTSKYFLGVDSGSTTTKIVLVDSDGAVVYSDYSFNVGDSYNTFANALKRMYASLPNADSAEIVASAATGYGESLLRTAFSMDYGIVETMAHFMAAHSLDQKVSFVLDIGGQDMKAIFVENGSIVRIEINEACSSGCGSFIMTFAKQLGYGVGDFARMACFAKEPYDLGTRCTVFMNSKVKQALREGIELDDIAAGFSYSVIKNCLFKVLKLRSMDDLGSHIVVQGGTFKNHSVARALEVMTGRSITFSDSPELAGAYGAAIYALAKHKEERQWN